MPLAKAEEAKSGAEQSPPLSEGVTDGTAANDAALSRSWRAYTAWRDLDSRANIFQRYRYMMFRFFDAPVTAFRERIVEPLRARYGHWPYYHRKFNRPTPIDECAVHDLVCIYEANTQYKLDVQVDTEILNVLRYRRDECVGYYGFTEGQKCVKAIEDFEEAELNYFIKYGELGMRGDAPSCYMKQKHRLVWERRHPEAMAERARLVAEHKEQMAAGVYNYSFWKSGLLLQDKGAMQKRFDDNTSIVPHYDPEQTEISDTTSPLKSWQPDEYYYGRGKSFLSKWFSRADA